MANFNSGIPIPQIFNLPDLTDANQRSYSVSTKRKLDDSVSEEPIQNPPSEQTVRIWCIRTKDVGTRLASEVQRNERIVALAKLPPNNRLTARSIYWFLTKEAVEVRCTDTILFVLKHPATQIIVDNSIYYLTQIDFQKNKRGTLTFVFPDGSEDRIYCCSTSSRNNKRARLSPANNNNNVTPMQVVDDESQSAQATPISIHSSGINQFGSNFSSLNGISPSSSGEVLDYIYEDPVVEQVPTSIPQPLQTDPLVANYLLLVPDNGDYIHMAHSTLINCGFNLEVSSTNQQHLYSQKRMNNTIRHVLLFPYEKEERFYVLDDYLPATSEVILMLENQDHQQDLLLAVSRVNEMRTAWEFTVRGEVKTTELKFTTLSPAVKLVFSIEQLRDFTIGGACWKKSTRADQLAASFKSYFLQWTLGRVTRQPSQIIFLCFKYEPKRVLAFTEYATTTLAALGIEFDMGPVVVKGSVLVYLRCPAYVPWYILQRKKDILDTLREDGLTEIYEAFISDVEASMRRPGNEEYLEELEHLREQMISDGIAEQPTPKKFRLVTLPNLKLVLQSSSHLGGLASNDAMMIDDPIEEYPSSVDKLPLDKAKLLTDKWVEMKKFDNKWTKTLEECYNSDKLRQQLFNFKTDKNAKIAVRVFLSSASAGLATNVAKLMRQFRGKSIVDGVHSGLQIGNTIIEWNQSGIVHIGELKYGNAVAVLFNVKDEKFDFNEENAQKMINFIQKWNTECQYSTKEFNSHRFVREFLQYTMNVSLVENFKGPLGSYMDDVMRTGDVTPRLISKTLGTMVFKSHKDLEDKDRDIRDKLSEDELKLLKIFHRGFQLEEAANGQDVSSCCYGLPTNGLEILNDSGKPMNH